MRDWWAGELCVPAEGVCVYLCLSACKCVCVSGSLVGLQLGLCGWLSVSAKILNIKPC